MSTPPESSPKARRNSSKMVLKTVAGFLALFLLCVAGLLWYANTASFQAEVLQKIVASIEDATGGRVELQSFQWHLFRLEVEVDNLTVHGLEGPGEIPYAHIDHLLLRAKILSLLRPSIGLSLLQAEHPVLHLIVNADGTTNQPTPKTKPGKKRATDTLLDLAVERAEITQGFVLINEKAIPFDLAANQLGVQLRYIPDSRIGQPTEDHYFVTMTVADLTAHRLKQAPVHSALDLAVDLHRNQVQLQSLRLRTNATTLNASGSLTNFANPEWKLAVDGDLDLREVKALAAVDGLDRGFAELHLTGAGNAAGIFTIAGKGRVADASYTAYDLNLTGLSASAAVRATDSELLLQNVSARLKQGGMIEGTMRIANWLSSEPEAAPARSGRPAARPISKPLRQVATIRARISDITLRTVLAITATPQFRDLGFDTAASGNVAVDWTGSGADLTVDGQLSIAPPAHPVANEVPVTGTIDAKYVDRNGTVNIANLTVQTPATQLQVSGALGVYPVSQQSQLKGTLTTTNLGEFNQTLIDLGLRANGKAGTQAIPVQLHGQAEFQGTVTGTVTDPDVKGHLVATNFGFILPESDAAPASLTTTAVSSPQQRVLTQNILNWDRLDADAEYTSKLISVQVATVVHGQTTIHLAGQLHARQTGRTAWTFDELSPIDATAGIRKGSVAELLAIAGESSIPVTGTVDIDAHLTGSLDKMSGGGHLNIAGGEIYGEPYHSLTSNIGFAGHQLSISQLSLLQNGGRLMGDGSYDIKTKIFHGTAQGRGFELAHIHQVQTSTQLRRMAVSGLLQFDASGEGTLQNPTLQAKAHLANLVVGEQAIGDFEADAHTEQHSLVYAMDATSNLAKMHLAGNTELTSPNQTRAQVVFSQFDINVLLELAKIQGVSGHSVIAGMVSVAGPLAQPRKMSGEAELSQLEVNVASVPLKSEGRVHATLQAGVLHLDPLHITGDETDLKAQGSVAVFDRHDLDMHMNGRINVKLAQTLNPDITSSGHVEFGVDASGTVQQPNLIGQMKFINVSMSLQDLPNGLSQMNGTLQFNQDRLEVKDLTASTGGGQLHLGGYLTYRQGLYGDLTAVGKAVRIRYPQGVSSVADATLRLQGQPMNMLLSGNVVVTRFAISPDLDIAGLAGSANTISAPPPDDAPSNHIRLDVSITSAPQLVFQNSLAKLAGDVDLHVRGTIANPSLLGRVNITDGSATFAGTQYQLQRGDIYFSNPVRIEPNIDVDATARVEDYDINIGLHGTPSNLNASYRSEPPLPQADVIALLAVGRTQDEQRIYSQQAQAAGVNPTTDALLSGALNATVSNRVQKLFGVGSVKIDPTFVGTLGTSTVRITVEQQVAKNVLVAYATNVNTTAQQLIQVQVNLTRNVSIVTTRDESGVFSMVLKVHKRIR